MEPGSDERLSREREGSAQPRRCWLLCAAILVVLGVGLRMRYLSEGTLFIDEAESCVNALTILEHGVPTDSYLGLPLFENTLTEPWPESAEYEFRDTSYANGLAVYHGWLPLYAIAGSLALHGIRPDAADGRLVVRHTDEEIVARIRAARLPSVVFAALFLVALFFLGHALLGPEAGLCALLAAATAPKCIWIAQQARYYSAGLAFSTLAMLCTWHVLRRGRWRDFLAAGAAFVLLFHTNSLSFAIALAAASAFLPRILRHERALAKLGAFLAIVALGLVPWMLWTGFWENTSRIPMARELLVFPTEYFTYLRTVPVSLGLAAAACGASLLLVFVFRERSPQTWAVARALRAPVVFIGAWLAIAFFGFQLLVPAASCSMARLTHQLVAPGILLGSLALAALARIFAPRRVVAVSATACLLLLVSTGNALRWQRRNPVETAAVFELVRHLRELDLPSDARVYSLPYQHFSLAYYTGIPVQSIAPVRRDFLERHPGELVILETVHRSPTPPPALVLRVSAEAGIELSEDEAAALVSPLHRRLNEQALDPLVRTLEPRPIRLEEPFERLLPALAGEIERCGIGAYDYGLDNPALFHDQPPMLLADFWPAFFWHFVGPERRTGAGLNYAARRLQARARLLDSTWSVLLCPPRPTDPPGSSGNDG